MGDPSSTDDLESYLSRHRSWASRIVQLALRRLPRNLYFRFIEWANGAPMNLFDRAHGRYSNATE